MRIHRSAHERYFTTLTNTVIRDSRLSFCARGILAHLLSQPDGTRDDIRTLTQHTPGEGRERVASAMRELEQLGYLKRTKKRTPEGRIYTEVDVFETPGTPSQQATTTAGFPAPGDRTADADGDQPVKEPEEKKPTLPAPPAKEPEDTQVAQVAQNGREGFGGKEMQASAEILGRVSRIEPKLSLGRWEALRLAPLVFEWRQRGATDLHIINSLTAGLPRDGVHHPARFLKSRLVAKMPDERRAAPTVLECDDCGVPVRNSGLCCSCRKTEQAEAPTMTIPAQTHVRGAAMVRAALRGLPFDDAMPALI